MFLVVSQSKYSRGKSGSISGVEHSVLHLQFPIIQQQTSTPKVGARLSLLKQGRDRRLSKNGAQDPVRAHELGARPGRGDCCAVLAVARWHVRVNLVSPDPNPGGESSWPPAACPPPAAGSRRGSAGQSQRRGGGSSPRFWETSADGERSGTSREAVGWESGEKREGREEGCGRRRGGDIQEWGGQRR